MELIYSMRRKLLKYEPPHFESPSDHEVVRPICTISTCNIIAFSSPTELDDTEGDTWGGHVYVCDLDTPWNCHKVTSTAYPVSALEWDMEGKQLLVATTVGDVSVYTQKDYLLNEWTCLYTASFPGEHIIRAVFFHNGRRLVMVDKKPDAPITERIQMLRSTPTLKGFGGVACEGACIITATGLIGVLTPAEGGRAHVATDCLRPTRDHITAASIAHKNGSLVIAAVCRSGGSAGRWCVRCVCAAVTSSSPAPAIALSPLPTIYLPQQDSQPVSITWCQREDTDSLLIAGATLTMWKCTERAHQVHKLFAKGPIQGNTTPGGGPKPVTDCFNTLVWQKTVAWGVEGGEGAVCAASSRTALGAPHAVLATPRALHLLARDTHHYLCSRAVITSGGISNAVEASSTPPKKAKYGTTPSGGGCAMVSCVEMSQLGGVVLAIDTHAQLHLYKLPQPWADIPTPIAVQHATNLLEYAVVSGYDCLDVLVACTGSIKHNILEMMYERLTESFQRQPAAFQQYYFHSWLKLRIALCRLIPSAQSSVSWLTCLQSLQACWAAVSLALRPDDKPDAAPLAALLDDHSHEQDKTLLTLEAKPDAISEAATLQPLRLCLQRAIDIGLTALLSLAYQHQHQHQMHPNNYEVWADGAAVQLVRRLALAARAGGRAADALLRPLARLAAPSTPRQELIEECLSLSTQWTGARVWESLPRCNVAAPHGNSWPLYLEYGVEPEALRYNPEPPGYAQCETAPSITMDAIRYMYVGGGLRPARWRQCGRCGSRALSASQPNKHPLQGAYDGRFLAACRCGGKWTLFSNI
ncbi:mediator of RNA polymerase II transcription subunit 16-like [Trichoplusia ni]|uniref:Mediator of RNA polymerase II transcription subunit 16 n=2 Tax=Trichoplusia ni TaxID=7111 RepID=A0A7E5WN70_TRINI|nr:mediator of RNA polymerase II transcription subunit 16-like isoform X1 [Trichoplusia ni]XP_026742200.1 mediator of RNA polymerase II transcription subunit 16-like [Trichoplusia ni]